MMIIDFHTHIFPDKIAARTLKTLSGKSKTLPYTDGTAEGLAASMLRAGVDYSINMPVMTTVDQVEKVNTSMIENRESYLKQGIITFGGMHPDYPDYQKELRRLKENGIAGIKIHPAYQSTDIDDIRMMRIIDAASAEGLIILTHAGIDVGIPGRNYCSTEQILHVMDTVHPPKLVLAHMGGWAGWDEVRRDLAGAPLWYDTAFSIGPITPAPDAAEPPVREENLSPEDCESLIRALGTDRVLFGTDSPWADQSSYVSFIEKMGFSDAEKAQIFSGNTRKLFE